MDDIEKIFLKNKVIPVVVTNDIQTALGLSEIFLRNGINIIEITLRTQNACDIIFEVSKNFPEITVGAGTVLSSSMAIQAKNSGAKFAVSPGFTDELIEGCEKITEPEHLAWQNENRYLIVNQNYGSPAHSLFN